MDYPIVIVPLSDEDGGGFMGYAPDLTGCMSDGANREEALANTQEAIAEWIETAHARQMTIPEPFSAAERAREQAESVVKAIKDIGTNVDDIDDRISELERVAIEIEEKLEHNRAWGKFQEITGVTYINHGPVRRIPC